MNFKASGSSEVGEVVPTVPVKAAKAKPSKSVNRMSWDNNSVNALIGEVTLANPFQFRYKTSDRARAWQQVAEGMVKKGYKVDCRAVRDRIHVLKDKVKAKNNVERAASGIAVEETEEELGIREAVERMMQEEEDIELAPKERGDEQKKKAEGEELRKRACETMGETRKRHQDEAGTSTTPKRQRNKGRDTLAFLDRKMELEQEMKREDLEKRREEQERQRAEEMERRREEEERRGAEEAIRQRRFELMQQQMLQQQQQALQQQQQQQQHNQQMETMMMALIKSLEKNFNVLGAITSFQWPLECPAPPLSPLLQCHLLPSLHCSWP
ncbi:vicilin-like seed storage protein At2g18540 isoform X1 [Strongylocentrotus purpuratus]|uniref:Uncharacterized protein n=2 Tax=Strongylocentrotus purpuratus TaxID=7668 RepID=A0A7M7N4V4_STRPU|nr:vicilin-like seed storage protein At2g18540 isoform X1 [Strongylocentrotus purpuratus]